MRRNIHPDQISLFDSNQDGRFRRERERERERVIFTHTYDDIKSVENLLLSWKEFLNGKRKRKDVAEFSVHFMDNIFSLHQELTEKTYKHGSYTAFKINDPKPRDIHKAHVRDRLLHHAIYRVLYPYFDPKFIYDSYSCRVDKGTHRAINRFRQFGRKASRNNTKTAWVLKCDIRKFFANIDHKILKDILRRYIQDEDILWLLGQVIDSFRSDGKRAVGLPLGNLTSQLLINIYMNEFDQFVKRKLKTKYYIRYADDFIFLSDNKPYLEILIPEISEFLETELKLSLHPDKLYIKTLASGVDFLGYITFHHYVLIRTKTKRRMFKKLREKIGSDNFNESLQSYLGYISHANSYKVENKLKNQIWFWQFRLK